VASKRQLILWLAVKLALECDYFNARCLDVDGGLVM
jgi:3-oxoacyl-[acyl-carrier protein] reductase